MSPRLFFDITVVPSSGKQTIIKDKQNRIKVYLKNPPEDGKANQELIKFISQKLKITQEQISITHGLTTRKKRIAVATELNLEQLLEKLGIVLQKTFL